MMISINNETVINMMKVIRHQFIEKNIDKIKIEPGKYFIVFKYIRDPECSIRDFIMVFGGNGHVRISGINASGEMITNKKFYVGNIVRDPSAFYNMILHEFGIDFTI